MNKNIQALPLSDVDIEDSFWTPRLETNTFVSLENQYEHLQANGCLDNFRRVNGEAGGNFEGPPFIDSNAYKWLEAASYALIKNDVQTLTQKVDEVISLLERAQSSDGYLFTYYMLTDPKRRWTNFTTMHELYCAGHLIEAGVAHHQATGTTRLLKIARRFADHIDSKFGPHGQDKIPGHEEIERALIRLYQETNEDRYFHLAEYFIERRGQDPSPLKSELNHLDIKNNKESFSDDIDPNIESITETSSWSVADANNMFRNASGDYDGSWVQDHEPIRQQETVKGHAVRAGNLYSAVAMYLAETYDSQLFKSLEDLWDNMVNKHMYITGGIGSDPESEAFGDDYHLPNRTAFAETCATVSAIFWSNGMFNLTKNGKYIDILERLLYNGLLAGISLDGNAFCYSNPLASDGSFERKPWYYIACCPPNLSRVLASLHQYIYAKATEEILVNLYISSTAQTSISGTTVQIKQRTDYPWDGDIDIEVSVDEPSTFAISLRIPRWTEINDLHINDEPVVPETDDQYLIIERKWYDNDRIELSLPLDVDILVANPEVQDDAGHAALRRGPLIYCLEGIDNDKPVDHLILDDKEKISAQHEPSILDGVTTLKGTAIVQDMDDWQDRLYRSLDKVNSSTTDFIAIPYYAWNNRGSSPMTVWMRLA